MLRRLLDSPKTYFVAAGFLLLVAVATQLEIKPPSTQAGDVEEILALRDRGDLNLVFLLIDTLRADRIGAYGYHRPTSENMDVLAKNPNGTLKCRIVDGGILKSKRHVNLPGIRVNLPAITKKDKADILFALAEQVDFIALSFVRSADDVRELKQLLGNKAGKIKIIAKIEDQSGITHLDEILREVDGIMIARGDLGVEINLAELPNVQRQIVKRCAEEGKRVIVATHLLESMIENPIPTRAEVTDVANAIYSAFPGDFLGLV